MSDALRGLLDESTPVPEALRLLARVRATPDEGRALDRLLARHARAPLPEPLLVATAAALIDRGERAAATAALGEAASSAALMLRAELAAASGALASAVGLVERVLLRDLDWPGARERRERWLAALGPRVVRPTQASAADETVVTSRPDAPFRLLREVGRGGAGVVYEAEDQELGRRVALKVYHRPDRDRDQLLHEARVAVALAGQGVVRVFDVDPVAGWLAMEWVAAGTLRRTLEDPAARAALWPLDRWALPLSRALARVHAAGWVHHDVKPANLVLRAPDDPLLGDFGTARRAGEPSPPGSLGYVSPERLSGRASDPRDDVYGLGRVLADAIEVLEVDGRAAPPGWRALAAECSGMDAVRPSSGEVVVRAMERLGGRRGHA